VQAIIYPTDGQYGKTQVTLISWEQLTNNSDNALVDGTYEKTNEDNSQSDVNESGSEVNLQNQDSSADEVVWINTEIVINALRQLQTSNGVSVEVVQKEIERLAATTSTPTPTLEPVSVEATLDNDNNENHTDENEGILDDTKTVIIAFSSIIFFVVLVAGFTGFYFSIRKANEHFQVIANNTYKNYNELSNVVAKLNLLSGQINNQVYNKDPVSNHSIDSILIRLNKIENRINKADNISDPEKPKPNKALLLANKLVGISVINEWERIVNEEGFEYVLLKASANEPGVYLATDGKRSVLACIIEPNDKKIGYLIPSYQDPQAEESCWNEFYEVKENNSTNAHEFIKLASMLIKNENFYILEVKGALIKKIN
jgi:hypothetical protein